ncbi:DUF805 domain-containing protein [Pseudokineococcus sp. 5B2Z-1]|uniref:DUF805 domain-containing protein n=1 Tax=Pseudokineococcus sp. 5B2Z-1 TaxID=3132744 RepID=UPI0030A1599F
MSFAQSVKTVLKKYAVFSGRARRSEYWWFYLFTIIVSIPAAIIDGEIFGYAMDDPAPLQGLLTLALLLPSLAVTVRRLHDVDRRGWWILIGIVPIVGWIVLLVFTVTDSKPDNAYGLTPKSPRDPFAS